ncbi:MAG: hypothetical protein EHM47_09745 [Ignavibacteriales bacterium]|nr:MAG: hypothetical protein EHM47_09745 [Ignavibacteriales bacterium]
MLIADKHTDPVLSIINVAGMIIEETSKCGIVGYTDLLMLLVNRTSERVKAVFNYSLSLLYVLDKLEYIEDIDAIRLKS